jgi:hypothetical protein
VELNHRQFESGAPTQAWGADALSRSLDAGHANARRTFAIDRRHCDPLVEVDAVYRQVLSNMDGSPEHLAGAMLMRTHSHFLGAVSMAMSGMIAEAYVLLNRSLKTATQALFVAGHPQRQQLWINRHNDDAARASMQAEFKIQNIRRHLRQVDPSTAAICEKLLQRTIDHSDHANTHNGAHGTPARDLGELGEEREYFVHHGEVQRYCLRSATQVGICCLSIFYYVFADCYRSSGIPERLTRLRHGH